MKLKEERHIRELSPQDIIDTSGLDLNSEERRIFYDTILLAQQYIKYSDDYKKGKKELPNKDNQRWYMRFICDVLHRPLLIDYIESDYLGKIRNIVSEMDALGLTFTADSLTIENLYEKTIENIADHPITSFYDLKFFIGECTKPKFKHISEKIDAVDKKATLKFLFS